MSKQSASNSSGKESGGGCIFPVLVTIALIVFFAFTDFFGEVSDDEGNSGRGNTATQTTPEISRDGGSQKDNSSSSGLVMIDEEKLRELKVKIILLESENTNMKSKIKRLEEAVDTNKKGWDDTYAAFKEQGEQTKRLIARLAQLEGNGGVKIKTIQEWGPILHGKNMQEIKTLLGAPNRTLSDGQMWIYEKAVKEMPSGVIKSIYITFDFRNNVSHFQTSISGQVYRPSAFR